MNRGPGADLIVIRAVVLHRDFFRVCMALNCTAFP